MIKMGLTTINKERAILLVGKAGTGKTTKALEMMDNPIIYYADEIPNSLNIVSISRDRGILIEELNYHADKEKVLNILRNYKGKIVLTSNDKKSIPNGIVPMCKVKLAGSKKHLQDSIKAIAPRCEEPSSIHMSTFELVSYYLKTSDRDKVREALEVNQPNEVTLLSYLTENIHVNKLIFVDAYVKRRWDKKYFYEMLAYAHDGKYFGRLNMPKWKKKSDMPYILRKLGLPNEKLLSQFLKDEEFQDYARKKLNNTHCRLLGIEKKKKKIKQKKKKEMKKTTLNDFM